MLHLFDTQAFYRDRPIQFSVSKISTNLYIADCTDTEIKRFILNKVDGKWTSDNDMTQSFSECIGKAIEKIDKDKMKKINDFVRSCFATKPAEEKSPDASTLIQTLSRI